MHNQMIDSYDKLPVGKYLDCLAVAKDYDGEDRNLRLLSILSGKSLDELMDRPFVEVGADMKRAAFLAAEPVPGRTRKTYRLGPFELVPTLDYKRITTAQYVDFQGFTKDPGEDGRVVEVLSCFLVPRGHGYCDGYDPAGVQDAIRGHLSVTDAVSLYAFFFERYRRSMRLTLTSSARVLKRLPETEGTARLRTVWTTLATASRIDGDGSRTWTPFRRLSGLIGTQSGG